MGNENENNENEDEDESSTLEEENISVEETENDDNENEDADEGSPLSTSKHSFMDAALSAMEEVNMDEDTQDGCNSSQDSLCSDISMDSHSGSQENTMNNVSSPEKEETEEKSKGK